MFTYQHCLTLENDYGRKFRVRCIIYCSPAEPATRYTPAVPREIFVEEMFIMRGKSQVWLPHNHRYYARYEDYILEHLENSMYPGE